MKRLLTLREFCDAYAVGRTRAYQLLNEGKIQKVKIGASTRIPIESAEAWRASLIAQSKARDPGA